MLSPLHQNGTSTSGQANPRPASAHQNNVGIKETEIDEKKSTAYKPKMSGVANKYSLSDRRHSVGEPSCQSHGANDIEMVQIEKSGERSPGSQSLVSITSTATVISTCGIHDSNNREKSKQTLGDLLNHIECKSKSLLERDKYVAPEALSELQYLAHQSRYNSDVGIKRRILLKLVDSNILEIFIKVFKYSHSVDYLLPLQCNENSKDVSDIPFADDSSATSCNSSESTVGTSKNDCTIQGKPPIPDHKIQHEQNSGMKSLRAAVTLLWNTTDKSAVLCEASVIQGVHNLLLTDLASEAFSVAELGKDQNKLYLVKGYLTILQNMTRFSHDAREAVRSAGAVKILQQYLKSSLLMVKTKTLMLLSYIMSESENDIINASDKNLGFMLKILQSAMEVESHYSKKYGYWAVEAAAALNRLASFEVNKDRLVGKGIIKMYTALLGSSCSEEEKLVAAKGLWIVSFDKSCQKDIISDKRCIDALQYLEKNSSREEIRKTASGALWVLYSRSATNSLPSTSRSETQLEENSSQSSHVLISFQWASKLMVQRIKDRLQMAGYKVCTDVENASGSIMDAMSEAVHQSAVILICMSQKYKDSPSCRTEAEYAHTLGKVIIPLRIQPKYNPDGWLADLVGSKLFFDFSKIENIDKMIPNLIRELGSHGQMLHQSLTFSQEYVACCSTSTSPSFVNRHSQALSVNDSVESVTKWSTDEISSWLCQHQLNHLCERMNSINGELLMEMKKMKKEAPEFYYSALRMELEMDFISVLKFNSALDKL